MIFRFINDVSSSRKAILALYTQSFFALEVFLAPVMVLFYLKYIGLNFAEMSTLFSVILLLNWLFELPTGMLSDVIGRKRSFLIGKFLYLCGMLLLLVVDFWYGLILIAFLMALGNTLSSGNLHAICFDLFCEDGRKSDYHKYISVSNSITLIVSAIAAIVGGYLADINYSIVIYLDAIMLFMAIVTAWVVLPLDKISNNQQEKRMLSVGKLLRSMVSIASDGWKTIAGSPVALYSILLSALGFAILRTGLNFYQPMMERQGIELSDFGWWFAGFNIIASISAYFSSRISGAKRDFGLIIVITTIVLFFSALVIQVDLGNIMIFLAIAGHQIARGILPPYLNYSINACIPHLHAGRTTILSFSSLITAILAASVMSVSGYFVNIMPKEMIFSILSFVFMVACMVYYFKLKTARSILRSQDLQVD